MSWKTAHKSTGGPRKATAIDSTLDDEARPAIQEVICADPSFAPSS